MANTLFAKLPVISQKVYEEMYSKSVLVASCDNSYSSEFDMENRELDIPVYHDISVHHATIKEGEIAPAPAERLRASTIRVVIDKIRYSHWEKLNIEELADSLAKDDSEMRKKLVKKWVVEADRELGIACAKLPSTYHLDFTVASGGLISDGVLDKTNVLTFLDVLKAKARASKLDPSEFKLFTSEKLATIARDAQLVFGGAPAEVAFRNGFVGVVNGVKLYELDIPELVTRDSTTSMVNAEYGIWKTDDGIQYVIPSDGRVTTSYDLYEGDHLLGGKGFKIVQYYDFFNIYPERLKVLDICYKTSATEPNLSGASFAPFQFGTVK